MGRLASVALAEKIMGRSIRFGKANNTITIIKDIKQRQGQSQFPAPHSNHIIAGFDYNNQKQL